VTGHDGPADRSADVIHRDRRRTVDPDRFEAFQLRIENGLEWGVGALVEDEVGRLLLVREDGRWLLPGGGVEDGETRPEALVREVREETGITVAVDRLWAVTDVTIASRGRTAQFRFGTYTATPLTSETTADPGVTGEGIERAIWRESVPPDTLDRDLIRRIRSRR
jgi:8-oxo-dGTP pyrophosphatase MutT (NUDIX family)